jgi:predicted DNA-binding protein YlxM (UPF0122 family)
MQDNNLEELKKFIESDLGKDLKQFILKHYNALNSLEAIREFDDVERQTLEIKANKRAVEVLGSILGKITMIEDFQPSEKEKDSLLPNYD